MPGTRIYRRLRNLQITSHSRPTEQEVLANVQLIAPAASIRQTKLTRIINLVCCQRLMPILTAQLRPLCRKGDKSGEIKSIDAE